jgi:hypothetical protein
LFLGNFLLKEATEIFNLWILLENTIRKIGEIYKKNYIEKDIAEIIFAEIILNYIGSYKTPEIFNYSALSIDLATFNEDHLKKIDHKIKVINHI